jgi:hypothetical protein
MRIAIAFSTIAPGGPTTVARHPRAIGQRLGGKHYWKVTEGWQTSARGLVLRTWMLHRGRALCGSGRTGVGQGATLVPPKLLELLVV